MNAKNTLFILIVFALLISACSPQAATQAPAAVSVAEQPAVVYPTAAPVEFFAMPQATAAATDGETASPAATTIAGSQASPPVPALRRVTVLFLQYYVRCSSREAMNEKVETHESDLQIRESFTA